MARWLPTTRSTTTDPGFGRGSTTHPTNRSRRTDEERGMDTTLSDRRILVTGASSGIGEATARAIVAAGGQVALLARRTDRLDVLAEELDGIAVTADVADPEVTRGGINRAAGELGGLDGLINAAGVLRGGPLATTDPVEWRQLFEVNVLGVLHATQASIPHLTAADHSDVVNVSSMSGRRLGSTEMAAYAASKAAVHMLSEGMRRELQPDGVRVSVVAPGFVRTELFGERDTDLEQRLGERADAVGLSTDDVATAIVQLLAAPPHVVHAEVALLNADQ